MCRPCPAPPRLPLKLLQFGEGNFLRAFVDWMVEKMNEKGLFQGSVQIVKPRAGGNPGVCHALNAQGGRYHVVERGMVNGAPWERPALIQCVRGAYLPDQDQEKIQEAALSPTLEIIVSNVTEAGLVYRSGDEQTYPARLARLLALRAEAGLPGVILLPCELLENNGTLLKEYVMRHLQDQQAAPEILAYVEKECLFCNTLVDRIVSGFPAGEEEYFQKLLGEKDDCLVCCEPFFFLAVETDQPERLRKSFPAEAAGLNMVVSPDISIYRTRKVRMLNGAHTASVLGAIMDGLTTVDEMLRSPKYLPYLQTLLFQEVAPILPLPEQEKEEYGKAVLERFANPYAHHRLLSIALNSVSKWRARVLPSLREYQEKFHTLPPAMTQSLAYLLQYYLQGRGNDVPEVLDFFRGNPDLARILGNTALWGEDLTQIPRLEEAIRSRM
ncbi:MAG: tagaturonate reductase [Oligosphaeraceae bacterium]